MYDTYYELLRVTALGKKLGNSVETAVDSQLYMQRAVTASGDSDHSSKPATGEDTRAYTDNNQQATTASNNSSGGGATADAP